MYVDIESMAEWLENKVLKFCDKSFVRKKKMVTRSELRNKILLDLLAAPIAVIPVAIGLSSVIMGWAASMASLTGFGMLAVW